MKPSFYIGDFVFFEIDALAGKSIITQLNQTHGADKVPKSIWQKDLLTLPSPIQSSDCIGVWVSGPIPTCTASLGDTTLDIIRRERTPKKDEPPFNRYFHYIIKNSDGNYYISQQLIPDDHWAVTSILHKYYGDKFSEEIGAEGK
jgi:hypothetical protein